MNPIEQLRTERLRKAELQTQANLSASQVQAIKSLEQSTVQAFNAFARYLDGRVSKTEVVNQLKEIGTPDAMKVMSAVNDMHSTLKKLKNTDLTPVTDLLKDAVEQLVSLPKENPEFPEIPDSVTINNFNELNKRFEGIEDAISKLADKETPAPVVNVPETKLPTPKVNVEAPDFTTLKKDFKQVVTAIKGIVIPEPKDVDFSKVEKQLKTSNKLLKEISEKPMGGGSGGGHTTPYQDSNGKPVYVDLDNGNVPVSDANRQNLLAYAEQLTTSASITPTIGKKLQIHWVQVIADPDATAGNLVTIGFNGGDTLYKVYSLGREAIFVGDTDQKLDITLENAQPVTVNIQYKETD